MDSSRRAVEAYWRSRMIDGVTSDEDKVAPVYKLEEVCDLLRSSHVSIVKEVSEYIFRRLQHKSPIVKQKALRLIKYGVGKSGVEFRREMQRNSVAVRQLIHHKGTPDPLKGDALNKAVRETAQEALSAIFGAADDTANNNNKPAPTEGLSQRIQGFGNTNFEPQFEDKKSFLSEVVGIGSATIKQGLNSLAQAQSQMKNNNSNNDSGSYRSPNLRRSLTTEEIRYSGRNDEGAHSSSSSYVAAAGTWGQDIKTNEADTNGNSGSSYSNGKSREERLLETIVTSGGVRLQPTRDALHAFLSEASKLDAMTLSHALESKLQSHMWQVRVKAICVLEAILRKKDDENLSIVTSYFTENKDVVVKCSESPQASLREKANKVLSFLNGEQSGSGVGRPENNVETANSAVQMPDLIDTNDSFGSEEPTVIPGDKDIASLSTSNASLIDDFFTDSSIATLNNNEPKNSDDPFADVSFHAQNDKEPVAADIFSGMDTIDKFGIKETQVEANKNGAELFDIFGSNSEFPQTQGNPQKDVSNLMAGLSIDGSNSSLNQHSGPQPQGGFPEALFADSTTNPSNQVSNDILNNILRAQAAGINANPMFPLDPMTYNALSSGLMFNPMTFPQQPVNFGPMGNLYAQHQLLSTMANLQQMQSLHSQQAAAGHVPGTQIGGYASPLPDIFNPSLPTQSATSVMNNSKKEDTRAFDFISDHLAAARDPKRVN